VKLCGCLSVAGRIEDFQPQTKTIPNTIKVAVTRLALGHCQGEQKSRSAPSTRKVLSFPDPTSLMRETPCSCSAKCSGNVGEFKSWPTRSRDRALEFASPVTRHLSSRESHNLVPYHPRLGDSKCSSTVTWTGCSRRFSSLRGPAHGPNDQGAVVE